MTETPTETLRVWPWQAGGFDVVDAAEAARLCKEYPALAPHLRDLTDEDCKALRATLLAPSDKHPLRCWYVLRSYEAAVALADRLNAVDPIACKGFAALAKLGVHADVFMGADHGTHRSPRFEVFRAPSVGDEVSYGFNGDYYPDGKILTLGTGPKARLTTSGDTAGRGHGHTYYRRKLSPSWTQQGGTWSLVHGRRDERNPSF